MSDRELAAARLLQSSADHSYDPGVEIDWDAGLAPDGWFVPPERSSLWGTALWDRLTPAHRVTLTRHELASIASIGIWFETILMQLLIRDYHHQDPTTAHAQYALTEVADECRHSIMFGRMIAALDCPVYPVGAVDRMLGRWIGATAGGPRMFAAILIAEEVLDVLQREAAADDRVQPLVRMVSRIHVVEEARHVRYARAELARQIRSASRTRIGFDRLVIARSAYLTGRALIHPEVYRAVGIDPSEGRRVAWANPYHRDTLRAAGRKVVTYLDELGLIGGPGVRLWQRSGLL